MNQSKLLSQVVVEFFGVLFSPVTLSLQHAQLLNCVIAHGVDAVHVEVNPRVVLTRIPDVILERNDVLVRAVLIIEGPCNMIGFSCGFAQLKLGRLLLASHAVKLRHHQIETTLQLLVVILELIYIMVAAGEVKCLGLLLVIVIFFF